MHYRELGHYVQRILTYLKKKKSHSKPLYTQGSENLCQLKTSLPSCLIYQRIYYCMNFTHPCYGSHWTEFLQQPEMFVTDVVLLSHLAIKYTAACNQKRSQLQATGYTKILKKKKSILKESLLLSLPFSIHNFQNHGET